MKLTILSLTIGLLLTSSAYSQTYRPDFDCNRVNTGDSIAVMLCSNSQAAKHELEFDQVYYALRQNVGKDNWKALKQAAIADDDIFKECITDQHDSNGTPIASPECYIKDIDSITSKYKTHLSGVDLEEANRSIDEHIRLQQILINSGYLPGTNADGVYGEGTRTAIQTWQRVNHRSVSGFISNDDDELLLNDNHVSKPTNSVFDIKQNSNNQSIKEDRKYLASHLYMDLKKDPDVDITWLESPYYCNVYNSKCSDIIVSFIGGTIMMQFFINDSNHVITLISKNNSYKDIINNSSNVFKLNIDSFLFEDMKEIPAYGDCNIIITGYKKQNINCSISIPKLDANMDFESKSSIIDSYVR